LHRYRKEELMKLLLAINGNNQLTVVILKAIN
jgi:hypothetical protein